MDDQIKYSEIKQLQIWYRVTGLSFLCMLFIGLVYFLYVNQNFLSPEQYIIFMVSTIMYITIPTIMHLFLSSSANGPMLVEELLHKTNRYRWLEYLFSSSIMMICMGVLLGVVLPVTLAFHAVLNALVITLGAIADWNQNKVNKTILYCFSIILFSINWGLLLVGYFQRNVSASGEIVLTRAFYQVLMVFVLFCLFPFLFVLQHYTTKGAKMTIIDTMYVGAGFISKSVLYFITLFYF